jgi:putative transposase
MSRPLRIEFAGALYHVTSRGDRREVIFLDDEDRHWFLVVLSELVRDFNCLHQRWLQFEGDQGSFQVALTSR